MKIKNIAILFALACMLSLPAISGCTPKVGGSDFKASGAQQAYTVEFGTVVSSRTVQINDGGTNTAIGAVGGGVLGGVIGNMFGGGNGRTLATIGGALAGAAGGGLAGQTIGNQQGVEVTVSLDNGANIVVVQGADMAFSPGQRVRVTKGGGATRVSPM